MCHTNRKKSLRSLARERSKERIAAAAHGGGVVVPDVAIDGVVIGGGGERGPLREEAAAADRAVAQLRRDRIVTRLGGHRKRRFYPVISLPRLPDPSLRESAQRDVTAQVAVAVEHGADGVFLAAPCCAPGVVLWLYGRVREAFPTLFIGLNLHLSPWEWEALAQAVPLPRDLDAVWTAFGVDGSGTIEPGVVEAITAMRAKGWQGLHFTAWMAPQAQPDVVALEQAAVALRQLGEGHVYTCTGDEADGQQGERQRLYRQALGRDEFITLACHYSALFPPTPLQCNGTAELACSPAASDLLPPTDAFIVSGLGTEASGAIDRDKLAILADSIQSYGDFRSRHRLLQARQEMAEALEEDLERVSSGESNGAGGSRADSRA